jgi:alpha 1,2-mannosyltransferase
MNCLQPTRTVSICCHRRLFRSFLCVATFFITSAALINFLVITGRRRISSSHVAVVVQPLDSSGAGSSADMFKPTRDHADDQGVTRANVRKADDRATTNTTLIGRSIEDRCDDECSRFRRHVDAWPPDRPRAAIVMLLRQQSIPVIARSAPIFHANFNAEYRYPIVIFHESDLDPESERKRLRDAVVDPSLLFFQRVTFDIPSFINRSAVPHRVCFKTVGYRHMCRFHAITIYDEPILATLRYVWRLDDDSYILRPIGYDVFRFMADRRLRYGYAAVVSDYGPCIVGLWPAVKQYFRDRRLRKRFRWPDGRIFWNNFELSDLDMWRSQEYRDFVNYIDQQGGIFYRRWGDATIKTIAVTLFASKNETHHFKDIAYKHGKRVKIKG